MLHLPQLFLNALLFLAGFLLIYLMPFLFALFCRFSIPSRRFWLLNTGTIAYRHPYNPQPATTIHWAALVRHVYHSFFPLFSSIMVPTRSAFHGLR